MKEDIQRKADEWDIQRKTEQCRDVDEILKKAFREIDTMYPDAPLQVLLIPLANNLTILSIASGMSKEAYMRSIERTYELFKDSVSYED
jgi:DNA-binding phage protein